MFTNDCTLESVLRQQYKLASKANINISESDELIDFEREIYINLLIEEIKAKNKEMEKK